MLVIEDLLDATALARIAALLAAAPWQDGRRTAGDAAAGAKDNRQADGADRHVIAAAAEVQAAILGHALVAAAALPLRMTRPMFSSTAPGGGYGRHADNAVMGNGASAIRTDIAFTLFLTGEPMVEGGALHIEDPAGERRILPRPGRIVLYPATFLHGVEPVQRGERLAAIGWIQSRVRDPARRAVLFDLYRALTDPAEAALRVQLARSNLLRMWAEA